MKKSIIAVTTTILMGVSLSVSAGKPVSISLESDGVSPDGAAYSIYTVKCSNGDLQPLTAWDDRKKWCVGQDSTENCSKKQIKAAKAACK